MIVSTVPCFGCSRRVPVGGTWWVDARGPGVVARLALCGTCNAVADQPPAVVCEHQVTSLYRGLLANH